MSVTGPPDFDELRRHQPAMAGVVLRCDACAIPVFLRYRIKSYRDDRIQFHPAAQEVERPPENFSFNYLPPNVAAPFRDALGCYSNGLLMPFALMCHLTARAAFKELGEDGQLRCFDHVVAVQELAEIDDATFEVVRRVIFDGAGRDDERLPGLDRIRAAVLLETMKDMLYQAYVRGGKLRSALRLRQYFAAQAEDDDADSPVVRAV